MDEDLTEGGREFQRAVVEEMKDNWYAQVWGKGIMKLVDDQQQP